MKSKILGFLAVGLLAGPMAASASVIYEFNLDDLLSFVYEAPNFVTGDVYVPAADLTSCDAFNEACGSQLFASDSRPSAAVV